MCLRTGLPKIVAARSSSGHIEGTAVSEARTLFFRSPGDPCNGTRPKTFSARFSAQDYNRLRNGDRGPRYGAGEMTDRGAHVIDIAQLALDRDDSGPIEYQAKGVPLQGELYDTFMDFTFENVYPNGVRMIGHKTGPRGIRFEGTEGSIFVHIHGGKLEAEPASLLDITIGDNDVHLGRTPDHQRNSSIACVHGKCLSRVAKLGIARPLCAN